MHHNRKSLSHFNPQCPILIIVETRRPVNQGFGARATFLVWASDIALRLGAVVAVDDRFWSRGMMRGFHYGNSFSWAWQLFPFRNASSALHHLPHGMTLARSTLTADELMRTWKCNMAYKLQTGVIESCGPGIRWCQDRIFGSFDRIFPIITSSAADKLSRVWKVSNVSEPAVAVWHMRTGDLTLALRQSAAAKLKATIEEHFPKRGVRHIIATYQKKGIRSSMPWFESELGMHEIVDSSSLNDLDTFKLMLNAEVLVSTGSSFAHIPPALAPAGRQLHLYLPPKGVTELRDGDTTCCVPNTCNCEVHVHNLTRVSQQPSVAPPTAMNSSAGLGTPCSDRQEVEWESKKSATPEGALFRFNHRVRTHPMWMNSFFRKNTIPVTCAGDIYVEYRYKLAELSRGLDQDGLAPASIAMLSYESWMR